MAIYGGLMGFFDFLKSIFGGGGGYSQGHSTSHYQKDTSSTSNVRSHSVRNSHNPKCQIPNCPYHVYKTEHELCYDHWKQNQKEKHLHAMRMNRSISPNQQRSYDRLLSFLSGSMGKSLEEMSEQEISQALSNGLNLTQQDISAFLASPTARGLLGWSPRHDSSGEEHEGNEWTTHNGVKWYRPANEPGPWIRHG